MLILSRADVEKVLTLESLIETMARAMDELSSGRSLAPNRTGVTLGAPYRLLAAMPGFAATSSTLGTKLVTLFPDNSSMGLPSHQAVIITFDAETGSPTALLDGTFLTEMRTAACSAVATDCLAVPDAEIHAVLGTGAQALSHALAISKVRPITELRLAGRNRQRAADLAARLLSDHGVKAQVSPDFETAVRGAHVVSATTHSATPVIRRSWLSDGTHVNSVGFNTDGRELDDDTLASSVVAVDSREAATSPAPAGTNDILEPLSRALISLGDIHELGDLVAGRVTGRTLPEQTTVYKSVGVAVQDCAAAGLVVRQAQERSIGTNIQVN